jgi:type VI secretion system protein ImpA
VIKSKKTSSKAVAVHDWMAPVRDDAPCGVDLEYDPEFVVLSARLTANAEAQNGDFVGVPEPVSWSEVDGDCRRLMMRSKDIRLAVLFARSSTRLRAAAGLAEGLALLVGWLTTYPDQVHPQLEVDEDRAAALEIRMNALQSLTDAQGLLADVREIALTRSTAMRLQIRDVERAFAHPRPDDALAPESVTRQLEGLRMQHPSPLTGLDDALASVVEIESWSRDHLSLYAPDLSALKRLLRSAGAQPGGCTVVTVEAEALPEENPVAEETQESNEVMTTPEAADAGDPEPVVAPTAAPRAISPAMDRTAALKLIREARHWFEQHEPSSPIPVLLRRAEQFVGKRYVDVVKAIPVELLAQWESE